MPGLCKLHGHSTHRFADGATSLGRIDKRTSACCCSQRRTRLPWATVHGPRSLLTTIPPCAYEATLEAVRLAGIDLCPRHVLVLPALEQAVVRAVDTCLSMLGAQKKSEKQKVRCKGRFGVLLGFVDAVVKFPGSLFFICHVAAAAGTSHSHARGTGQ